MERATMEGSGRPNPALIRKLRELHELMRDHAVPCACGNVASKIGTRDGHVEILCFICAVASPLERRQRRTDAARRGTR